mmetsp:Transcript_1821/g.1941  ORF Transcript_1821/g.1941 Transcript_1821/m.1941 type:complete len:82 (+) Transcript_1821:79-324(+)
MGSASDEDGDFRPCRKRLPGTGDIKTPRWKEFSAYHCPPKNYNAAWWTQSQHRFGWCDISLKSVVTSLGWVPPRFERFQPG